MTVGQVTYDTKPGVAFAGMLADLADADFISRVNVGASLPFGVAVAMVDEKETQCTAVTQTGDFILGVAVHDHAHDNASLANALGIAQGDMVSILRRGRIYVICVDGCDEGDAVFVVHAGGGFRATDDGANSSALANCVWKTKTAAGKIGILEINLVGQDGHMT